MYSTTRPLMLMFSETWAKHKGQTQQNIERHVPWATVGRTRTIFSTRTIGPTWYQAYASVGYVEEALVEPRLPLAPGRWGCGHCLAGARPPEGGPGLRRQPCRTVLLRVTSGFAACAEQEGTPGFAPRTC